MRVVNDVLLYLSKIIRLLVINERLLTLQRTQLYSGLSATRDTYSELLELKHNVALTEAIEMLVTQ